MCSVSLTYSILNYRLYIWCKSKKYQTSGADLPELCELDMSLLTSCDRFQTSFIRTSGDLVVSRSSIQCVSLETRYWTSKVRFMIQEIALMKSLVDTDNHAWRTSNWVTKVEYLRKDVRYVTAVISFADIITSDWTIDWRNLDRKILIVHADHHIHDKQFRSIWMESFPS